MNTKKDFLLRPNLAALFARLAAGEELSQQEESKIRDNLWLLVVKIKAALYVEDTDEHRAWVTRQQAYTGRIVEVLAQAHFARLESEPSCVRLADAGNKIAVISDADGFRFHFWVSMESGKPVDTNLYKNPRPKTLTLACNEAELVVLSQLSGEGAAVAERMMQAAEALLPAYLGN